MVLMCTVKSVVETCETKEQVHQYLIDDIKDLFKHYSVPVGEITADQTLADLKKEDKPDLNSELTYAIFGGPFGRSDRNKMTISQLACKKWKLDCNLEDKTFIEASIDPDCVTEEEKKGTNHTNEGLVGSG